MKIFCVGRNYAAHAAELQNALPDDPVIFIKPSSALLVNEKPFYYPPFTHDLHHEIELVLRICKNGKGVEKAFAHTYYDAIGLGIDFTARDLQQKQKEKGLPWEIAKAFDNSAVMGQFKPKEDLANMKDISFSLKKNGVVAQQGNSGMMLYDFDTIICYVSQFFSLLKGDYIFTGTPAGVSAVKPGDLLEGYIGDERLLFCEVR